MYNGSYKSCPLTTTVGGWFGLVEGESSVHLMVDLIRQCSPSDSMHAATHCILAAKSFWNSGLQRHNVAKVPSRFLPSTGLMTLSFESW